MEYETVFLVKQHAVASHGLPERGIGPEKLGVLGDRGDVWTDDNVQVRDIELADHLLVLRPAHYSMLPVGELEDGVEEQRLDVRQRPELDKHSLVVLRQQRGRRGEAKGAKRGEPPKAPFAVLFGALVWRVKAEECPLPRFKGGIKGGVGESGEAGGAKADASVKGLSDAVIKVVAHEVGQRDGVLGGILGLGLGLRGALLGFGGLELAVEQFVLAGEGSVAAVELIDVVGAEPSAGVAGSEGHGC